MHIRRDFVIGCLHHRSTKLVLLKISTFDCQCEWNLSRWGLRSSRVKRVACDVRNAMQWRRRRGLRSSRVKRVTCDACKAMQWAQRNAPATHRTQKTLGVHNTRVCRYGFLGSGVYYTYIPLRSKVAGMFITWTDLNTQGLFTRTVIFCSPVSCDTVRHTVRINSNLVARHRTTRSDTKHWFC
jgi:hypothetical protein